MSRLTLSPRCAALRTKFARLPGIALCLMVVVTAPRLASGQTRTACQDGEDIPLQEALLLAERYAPVFWFAPGEQYYPTLPFFAAFEAKSDDGDPEWITPTELSGKASWAKLDSLYRGGGADIATAKMQQTKMFSSAVFYRIRCLKHDQLDELWNYLGSDEQAYKRFERDVARDRIAYLHDSAQWVVAEYYLYYLNDLGLLGHPHDIEMVYVFVPRDTVRAQELRISVGDAHTDRIPNNVRVDYETQQQVYHATGLHPWILVELGDHSDSPGNADGHFQPGLDANWHAYDLWGVRDVQAAGALGAIGAYQLWMTFPRVDSGLLLPPVRLAGSREDTLRAPRYGLFAAQSFQRLYASLASKVAPQPDSVRQLLAEIGTYSIACPDQIDQTAELCAALDGAAASTLHWSLAPLFRALDTQGEATVRRMMLWTKPMDLVCRSEQANCNNQTIGEKNQQPWEHQRYSADPDKIFKRYLFRPVSPEMRFRWVLDWHPGEAMQLAFAWEVPAFSAVPVRIPGYLELRAGIYFRCGSLITLRYSAPWNHLCHPGVFAGQSGKGGGTSLALDVVHTSHYSAPVAWYAEASYIFERPEVLGDSTRARLMLGAGLSLIPAGLIRGSFPAIRLLCNFHVRFGLSAGVINHHALTFSENRWEIQLTTVEPDKILPTQIFSLGHCAE